MGSLCVATFLLSVGSPYIADRMVLTEFPNTYAHVYREISKAHQFPLRKPSSDVFMIKSDTQRPGTSYAIYCSQKWNGKNIMDGLLDQIIPFTIDGPSRDKGRINPENPCSTQLASMAKKKNYRLIWTSEIIKSNACTGKDLLELALKGYITIHKHHFISPREYLKPKIRIYFDVGIEIQFGEEQVYFKGEKVNDETEDEILMWYTGYLHIFRRRIKKGGWYASTSLTSIDLNGYKISKFIRRNSPPFNRFIETWEFLETLVDKRDHYPGLTEKELTKERQRKTSHDKIERLKLDNLRPSDVHGFISSFKWYGDSSSGH
ncbi:BgTH12-03354 [Blumeria graminis f. sp. triticale]|uniref:BgtE-5989 n=3 Tax=Blumeria graminis TaxID=34373 RepID=A0A381LLF5_BLUGR|nr:putative secreted effector protein [Blumeria graminis f. sp. tritici 96224]CAD6503695.1 BgTH12-03354 [Blumeria graminis f. sp. triticale]VDB89882.1 BgtE-5989 [Blumeria graminis f. sp. tritici]